MLKMPYASLIEDKFSLHRQIIIAKKNNYLMTIALSLNAIYEPSGSN